MARRKSFTAETIFSLLGSLSILSVFVVMPYTIGYFAFFDIAYMNFFSLTEYLTFAAVPLLTVGTVVGLYFALPYLPRVFGDETEKFPQWFQRFLEGRKRRIFRRHLRVSDINWGVWIMIVLAVAAVLVPIFATIDFLAVALPFVVLVILFMTRRLFAIPRNILYLLMFVAFELLLLGYGRAKAIDAQGAKARIELINKDAAVQGYLLFAGASGLLLFDDQNKMFFIKLDGSGKVSLGTLATRPASPCVDMKLLWMVRRLFSYRGCP